MTFVKKEDLNEEKTSTTQEPNARNQNFVVPFSSIIDDFLVGGSLSQEANAYLKKLREILEDKTNPIEISVKKIDRTETAYLFSYKEFGIIIIFDDGFQDIYQIAKNELINNAISASKLMNQNNIKVLNAIIVTKHDYEKYNQMANYINSIFRIYSSNLVNNITVDSFGVVDRNRNIVKTESLVIDINLDNVRSYIESTSPMGIPARMDIGLICYKAQGIKNQNTNEGIRYSKKQKLFALSAYTEFVPDSFTSGKPVFTPVIHITDIVTPLMFPGILPIAILVGAEVFGAYKLWQTPYMKIKKGSVNIGNLLIDKNNKPKAITNEKELMYMFAEHFTPPAIVVDVTEGRSRIPSLALFANPNNRDQLSNVFKTFLNITNNDILKIIGKTPTQDIVGFAHISGIVPNEDIIDTRYIDYLNIVNLLGYDQKSAELFQKYAIDTLRKIELIKSITNEVEFEYLNSEVLLNGTFLKYLVEIMAGHIQIINPFNTAMVNTIDIKSLIDNTYSMAPALGVQSSSLPLTNNFQYNLF